MASVAKRPLRCGQTTQQDCRASVVADLACDHDKPDWAAIGIGDGMQLGVKATLRAVDQTAPLVASPPFLDHRLVAVLFALR